MLTSELVRAPPPLAGITAADVKPARLRLGDERGRRLADGVSIAEVPADASRVAAVVGEEALHVRDFDLTERSGDQGAQTLVAVPGVGNALRVRLRSGEARAEEVIGMHDETLSAVVQRRIARRGRLDVEDLAPRSGEHVVPRGAHG